MEKIVEEIAATQQTERGNRADDKLSETSMEDRKNKAIFKNLKNMSTYLNIELLRFTTAGSVDDGKSPLIGRLL